MEAFELLCRTEGIIPAHRVRARPRRRAWSSAASSAPTPLILVNLSGRGDKDMDTAADWFGLIDGATGDDPSGTADDRGAEGDGRTQL